MVFSGMQPVTLLDFPGKVAAIVFTSGCDMACPYCHNAAICSGGGESISESEVLSYLEKRKNLLDGVCISGGEPLLHKGIIHFIQLVKGMNLMVKLDTNGSSPEVLKRLLDDDLLDYVAMDIKNSFEKYEMTTGRRKVNIDDIKKSIDYLKASKVEREFRTTVTENHHTEEDMEEIGKMIEGENFYFIQNFKDSEGVIEKNIEKVSEGKLDRFKTIVSKYVKNVKIR